jgi:hypothetical protein
MTTTGRLVLVSLLLLTLGCAAKPVIPDPSVPHQVAKEVEVEVWVRGADGTKSKQKVRLLKGWWIAGPPVTSP